MGEVGRHCSLTTPCSRPRISSDVIENLAVITLNARRVMPGVRRLLVAKGVVMSFWVYRKARGKRRSLYLLGLPWELVLPLLGIAVVLIVLLLRQLGAIP